LNYGLVSLDLTPTGRLISEVENQNEAEYRAQKNNKIKSMQKFIFYFSKAI